MVELGLWMSIVERERAHLVRQTLELCLGQREASERLGISVRQFKRLVQAWKKQGDAGVVSRQRGRASNNRLAEGVRTRIALLLKNKYRDFGPTLAAEKLLELEGIKVSVETIRQMQVQLGLWKPKGRRAKRVFQVRERRSRFGELIQIDGSPHDWFEGRAPADRWRSTRIGMASSASMPRIRRAVMARPNSAGLRRDWRLRRSML
jgi:transposase